MRILSDYLREARRRRVFRTGGLYIVGAWVLLQVLDLVLESFGYPETAMRFPWYAAIAGFPLALVFGWRYDLTAQGIRRTPPSPVATAVALRGSDFVILGALLAIAITIGWRALDEVRRSELTIAAPPAIDPNSIAVLPLENLSGDPAQDYLTAGIQDALITSLSRLRRLRVTSRTSTLRLGNDMAVPAIGERLRVARLLEGSVIREGDHVRVVVQLIDAANDLHVWADSFDRKFTGVLAMQNEIARAVAEAIEMRLSPAEQVALPLQVDVRAETYEAYLRGMHLLHQESHRAYRRGVEILRDAVASDPESALAHAGLAYAYTKIGHSPMLPDLEAYRAAKDTAERAIELDPTLAEAHLAVGMYKLYQAWDWDGAEESLLRAIDINPSLVAAHYHYAWMLELFHDHEKALEHGEVTKRLDPLSPFMSGWLADQYRAAGLYDKAIAEAEACLELAPGYPVGLLILGMVLSETGRHDEAVEVHRKLGDDPFWSFAAGTSLARAGRTAEARAILASLPDSPAYSAPHVLLNASLHNDDELFRWLAIARETRAAWYPWYIGWFENTRYLADDARLQALADEIGVPLHAGHMFAGRLVR